MGDTVRNLCIQVDSLSSLTDFAFSCSGGHVQKFKDMDRDVLKLLVALAVEVVAIMTSLTHRTSGRNDN